MSRAALFSHMSIPAFGTLAGLALSLQHEPLGVEMLAVHVLGAGLIYSVPYVAWAIVCAAIQPSRMVWHAGFIACGCALVFITCMSFVLHDPSGLPYQWLAYWPLAAILLVAVVVAWLIAGRPHASA
jgi:hypothetical protein